jgi:hypothetical protein
MRLPLQKIIAAGGFAVLAIVAQLQMRIAEAQPPRDRPLAIQRQPGEPRRIALRLTAEAFAPIVDRDVDETRPVDDVILGTRVHGASHTTGKPTVELVDDEKCASFVLTLKGTTVSRTVGQNGPAIIRSRSETFFTATKRVVFEAGKGFVAQPAKINARTRVITEGLGSTRPGLRGRIVQRQAAPRVAESRPAAEEIVRQKAMRRVSAAFDRHLEGRLARLNRAIDMRQAIVFLMRGEAEPRYSFCTSNGCVQIVASTGADDEPAAAVQLPQLDKPAAPVELWVHESLVGDGLAYLLKQIDLTRREGGSAIHTLAAITAAFQPQPSPANLSGNSQTAVDYATADDWIVVQIQIAPARDEAGSLATQPSAPSASRR